MADFPELLAASRFYLELSLDGSREEVDAVFLECQGFQKTQKEIEIVEVTPNKWGQSDQVGQLVTTKIPGRMKTDNLVLRRGMTNSVTLWQWLAEVESGKWAKQLKAGSLVIYNQAGKEQARFDFIDAWPMRYKVADVSAQSTEIEIEELEIAIGNLTRAK
ncbi:MAG: phage tail protein [Leptolyngbya sp. SIO4C5]|nr:phage tail protein [Leptolyngbya sp. SIO4C5]